MWDELEVKICGQSMTLDACRENFRDLRAGTTTDFDIHTVSLYKYRICVQNYRIYEHESICDRSF